MPTPDSTLEEVRGAVLRYIRMYEEGQFTLGDLAAELAVMAAPYEHAIGAMADEFSDLLSAAMAYEEAGGYKGGASQHELERALTAFRRAAAAW